MPLFWLSLAFIIGIGLGEYLDWRLYIWVTLGVIALFNLLLIWLIRHFYIQIYHVIRDSIPSLSVPYPLLFMFLCLGAVRLLAAQPDLAAPEFIAAHNDTDKVVTVRGVLDAPADVRDTSINLRVEAELIRYEGEPLSIPTEGLLLARVETGGEWRYGDFVALRGQLNTPPEDEEFSYRDYLAHQGIYAYMSSAEAIRLEGGHGNPILSAIYALKRHALATVYQLWPDPEASLMAGILLGVETGIPANVQEAFKNTGTSHIIVISGFNITIIAGLFVLLFSKLLGRLRGAFAAAFAILVYTILVGADAAVVRAAIMGWVALLAWLVGRRQAGLTTLTFTAGVMAVIDPYILWNIGFLLSFAATLGLVLYAEPLTQIFTNLTSRFIPATTAERLAKPIGEYFLFTMAAMVTTLPVIIYFFHRFSIVSFIANPVILPVQPAVMVLGGLAVLLGLVYLPLGKLAGLLAWPFVVFTIRAVELFDKIPEGVVVLGSVSLVSVALFYALLFGVTIEGSRLREIITERWGGWKSAITAGGVTLLGLLTIFVWVGAAGAPDGKLHLTLLDTNTDRDSGEAVLIQSPSGRSLLINGGASPLRLSDSLGRRLPFFNRELDTLIIAGPEEGELEALPRVVEQYPPGEVLWAGPRNASYDARRLRKVFESQDVEIVAAEIGQVLDLGGGAELHVLTTSKRGAVFLLEWENFRVLLPLGANFEDLEELNYGRDIGPVTSLLLADNGYAASNLPDWIENLNPQVVLLSVALTDRDGRPDDELIDSLVDYTLLRTDQNGWIQLSTDGEQLWVEVERR
ncbi:MAG: ComEC/Rec2 family competence protein [Anaerolineales bacterium]|nr:ComEC/Rec2 family competence protein [Anaerolineales bacterium]